MAARDDTAEADEPRFKTQSEALRACLDAGRVAAWQGAGVTWRWGWHGGTA
jgi:hypothetical protein